MKKILLLILLFPIFLLEAEKINLNKSYRGIRFYPIREEKVESLVFYVPKMTERSDTIQEQFKYPISFFRADCKEVSECFSLLIDVSIIEDSIKSFDEIVSDSKEKDFRLTPLSLPQWKKYLRYTTEPMEILYGPGEIIGSKVIAFYYHKKYQKTYRLTINMIYTPNFPEKDWDEITNHAIAILNSVTIR
ncbi:hypothetical protein EHQ10_18505 [Leptospira bouyouniensis]|uniref:Lipoprotein n=2 Tax=Leptospira bouyouniensis TaxID=2484911 RepID=A0ABY2L1X4_9LEPT|nr:hypothetical protein EHQ10_18505 [Leptospira bouyouniensis]